jgi:energy-coupling factor transport system substrate-specific component
VVITALSAAVIAGVGGWALTTALARTGVLDRFPVGRERAPV